MEILIRSIIVGFVISLVIAFMKKGKDEENMSESGIIVLDCKKNVKIVMTIVSLFGIVIFPIIPVILYIQKEPDLVPFIIMSLIFFIFGLYLLIGMKYQKIIYNNGSFIKKRLIGKERILKFDDVVNAKYKKNGWYDSIILYDYQNKKFEINSYLTHFHTILKEMKIRHIDIYN